MDGWVLDFQCFKFLMFLFFKQRLFSLKKKTQYQVPLSLVHISLRLIKYVLVIFYLITWPLVLLGS